MAITWHHQVGTLTITAPSYTKPPDQTDADCLYFQVLSFWLVLYIFVLIISELTEDNIFIILLSELHKHWELYLLDCTGQ